MNDFVLINLPYLFNHKLPTSEEIIFLKINIIVMFKNSCFVARVLCYDLFIKLKKYPIKLAHEFNLF